METFISNPSFDDGHALRHYDPLNDYLFYKIMGEKGDEIQLLGFINAVLEKTGKGPFSSVEILEDKSFTPEIIGDKSVTLDVRAVLINGARVNVEVQLRNQHNMDRRSLFYWSKEYSSSLKAGQNYQELPNVIAINIVNYDFPALGEFHCSFHLREDRLRDFILTNALEIHYLNMVQYRKRDRKDMLDDPLYRWLTWFDKNSPPELVAEVVRMDNAIQMADERMVYITGDKEAIRAYERRFKAMCDMTSWQDYAWDVGKAAGKAEGIAEGKVKSMEEIARRLKTRGRPLEEIAEDTGLTLEVVEKL